MDRNYSAARGSKMGGMAQAEGARKVGVSRTTVSDWNEQLGAGGLVKAPSITGPVLLLMPFGSHLTVGHPARSRRRRIRATNKSARC
jgi:DNA-binding XRE family transcriptional regulator